MSTVLQNEISAVVEARRKAYVAAAFRFVEKGLPAAKIDEVCREADRTPDEFKRLVERIIARRKAADDLKEAAKLAAEQARVGERLEAAHNAVKAAEERVEQLRREQLAVLAESSTLSNRVNSLRSAATATLQSTADPAAPDWRDPANVRIDDAPAEPSAKMPSFGTWYPGDTGLLPAMRHLPARG